MLGKHMVTVQRIASERSARTKMPCADCQVASWQAGDSCYIVEHRRCREHLCEPCFEKRQEDVAGGGGRSDRSSANDDDDDYNNADDDNYGEYSRDDDAPVAKKKKRKAVAITSGSSATTNSSSSNPAASSVSAGAGGGDGGAAPASAPANSTIYVLTAHELDVDATGFGRAVEDKNTVTAGAFSSLAVALSHAYDAMVSASKCWGKFLEEEQADSGHYPFDKTDNFAALLAKGSLPPGEKATVYRVNDDGDGGSRGVWVEVKCLEVSASPGRGSWEELAATSPNKKPATPPIAAVPVVV
jgi:hypothetical protein